MNLSADDIARLEPRYRATLINSLTGVRPAVLIGTRSHAGENNLAIFNSLVHLGADPALNGLLFRPATVERNTLNNILETGVYTINFVRAASYKNAHQTSAKYPKGESEFEAAGFAEQIIEDFHAPFVADAVIRLAMKFHSKIDIAANGTIFVIGSVQQVYIPDEIVSPDGFVAPDQQELLTCAGLDAYFKPVRIGRLAYARPGIPPIEIQN
jgi:flavin reductase (DIM6/NTAB) family NADH-FMN oxidoreductase RutF